jgi:hypothetical protein
MMKERMRMGIVMFDEGKYFLEVEGRREELPLETVVEEEQLKKLVGQEVEVFFSEPRPAVVGIKAKELMPILCYIPWPPWPPCFLCYLPVPWLIRGVEREVQINLAKRFREEGYISEEVFERLI